MQRSPAGAAMDSSGTVAMAFMGAGVYLFQNGMVLAHPTERPNNGLYFCILSIGTNYSCGF